MSDVKGSGRSQMVAANRKWIRYNVYLSVYTIDSNEIYVITYPLLVTDGHL